MSNQEVVVKVLVANDQPLMRSALINSVTELSGKNIRGGRCSVRAEAEADSIEAAQRRLGEASFDLFILEIELQRNLCFELIEWTRENYPSTKILVVSKHLEEVFAERVIRAGADGFVSTCASIEEIRHAATKVLSEDMYLSPRIERAILQRVAGSQNGDLVANPCATLSNRELHILHYYGLGSSVRQMASQLDLSVKTVETYRDRLKEKLGLNSAYELLRYALECQVFGSGQNNQPAESNGSSN